MTAATAPSASDADRLKTGLVCGVLAYAIWGMFPLYLKQLDFATPAEIVAHRIVWSVPFGAALIALRRQWADVLAAVKTPRVLLLLGFAATLIAGNWLIYVWAVANARVLEASLGYYINPLMFIAAGVFILREKLNRVQIVAVCLAALGVLTLTFGAGVFPWVSLLLAFSFMLYGYVRKTTPVGAMPGLFVETCLLSPFAAVYLAILSREGAMSFGAHGAYADFMLVLAGPVTVIPLLLFALAARRLTLSTLGFLQYIGPTGQLLLGLYYGESFTRAHAICFGLIWIALALISVDAVRRNRAERLARAAAGALPVSAAASEPRKTS